LVGTWFARVAQVAGVFSRAMGTAASGSSMARPVVPGRPWASLSSAPPHQTRPLAKTFSFRRKLL
jgi:hypothetical protein